MPVAARAITCGACGRSFAWKSEYAGKTLRCKCGEPIKAPAATAPPGPKATAEPQDDFSRLQAEAEYELAATSPPPTQRKVMGVPAAVAATAGGPASPVLGHAGAALKSPPNKTEAAQVSHPYIPLALIVAGVIAYFFDAHVFGTSNPIFMFLFVLLNGTINLAFVFIGLMIGVKLVDLELGGVGPAVLKIAAVGLLPAASGDVIGYYTMSWGYTMAWMPWGLTLLMYFGLMSFLFEMDLVEGLLVACIIWVAQKWLAMFLIALILSSLGANSTASKTAGAVAGTMFSSPSKPPEDDLNPTEFKTVKVDPDTEKQTPVPTKEIDDRAQKLISDGKLTEARQWIDPVNVHHIHDHLPRRMVRELIDQLYDAGARKVYAAGIETRGPDEFITQLLVDLPDDAATRKKVLEAMDKHFGRTTPMADAGGRYMVVPVLY